MSTQRPNTKLSDRDPSLLHPSRHDADSGSLRSHQDTDSDDDERQNRAKNSRELRAHDRLVLMEEDELDQLVIENRRKLERGSGLPLPNPLKLFSRRQSDASHSRSRSPSARTESWAKARVGERRSQRRVRRNIRKDRFLADAHHGEDGILMQELEEGGLKAGSSTGESSGREDSGEMDRKGLLQLAAEHDASSRRSCHRWFFTNALIAVGFALMALIAWKLSPHQRGNTGPQRFVSNGTALFALTTIIISLDGFRADFLNRGITPRLNAFVKQGVSPPYMLPSFPSVTFPNHYTLATGLYPEAHGIVGNSFWDPHLRDDFFYTDPARSLDPKWWSGEPFWVTAEKQGVKTAMHMWPGSEAHIQGIEPTYLDKYNGKEKLADKVDRILEFLDKPDEDRPQIIAGYVPNVDTDGHRHGPNSTEIRTTIQIVDGMLDDLFRGMEARNLTEIVNVIVVSDHGMATTDTSRLIQLEDLVDLSRVEHTEGWPLIGLRPKIHGELQDIYDDIVAKAKDNPNLEIYLRDVNMPVRYHFSKNDRIAPLWIVPKTGWAIVKKEEMDVKKAQANTEVYHPRGLHGYDHEHPLMRAIFIARGPAFPHPPNSKIEPFQNIGVYNIICDSVGLLPKPNNGTLRLPLTTVGLHGEPEKDLLIPADPAEAPSPAPTAVKSGSTIMVDPVTPTDVTPSNPIGIDPPESLTPAGGEDNRLEDGIDKAQNTAHEFWDWFTGKADKWWGKLSPS